MRKFYLGGLVLVLTSFSLFFLTLSKKEASFDLRSRVELLEELHNRYYEVVDLDILDDSGKTLVYARGGPFPSSGIILENSEASQRVNYVLGEVIRWEKEDSRLIVLIKDPRSNESLSRLEIEVEGGGFTSQTVKFGIEDLATGRVFITRMEVRDISRLFPKGSVIIGFPTAEKSNDLTGSLEVEILAGRLFGGVEHLEKRLGKELSPIDNLSNREELLTRGFLLPGHLGDGRRVVYYGAGHYSGVGTQVDFIYTVGKVVDIQEHYSGDILVNIVHPLNGEKLESLRILLNPLAGYPRLQTATPIFMDFVGTNPGIGEFIGFANNLGREKLLELIDVGDILAAEPIHTESEVPKEMIARDEDGAWLVRKLILRRLGQ